MGSGTFNMCIGDLFAYMYTKGTLVYGVIQRTLFRNRTLHCDWIHIHNLNGRFKTSYSQWQCSTCLGTFL